MSRLIDEISDGHINAISEGIIYAFARQAVYDAFGRL